jgi:hypothetical protein
MVLLVSACRAVRAGVNINVNSDGETIVETSIIIGSFPLVLFGETRK